MAEPGSARRPPNPWVWLLAIALLALVAWSIGRMVSDGRRPESEIGVTGDPRYEEPRESDGERGGAEAPEGAGSTAEENRAAERASRADALPEAEPPVAPEPTPEATAEQRAEER